ncbi:diacylglycerol kinase [Thermosipho melanesiensis]|uniref:diacylglycerol kinase family protein n=1 Tax=Thermosipho melanesiensis TaxID=46541 RepID=UPI0003259905|nr:diacylglycerol kinase family protein [Thermosipho melanesiensis]OOC35343.1 diacylglycerol kinase [Thermosipho melanesiensis]OOC35560.1 diacylglycerol kinase [Thermosipho melanesiensis]OOC36597.1 diacylglycerol kinase [Thermosipho melanesiensis]OOC40269.1 diacylglycerol kinase [Thermosipho melanesiensis]OOC42542.1 diacylglycerol kinase [Thermosipho melanesiensis]
MKEKPSEQLGSSNLKESFSHAIEGIVIAISQEKNLRIHFFVGFIVLFISLFLPIDKNNYIWIFFAVFFVIISELINTLIENLLDLFIPEYHPIVKIIKDISSGIVLWAAMFSVVVGIAIIGNLLFSWNIIIAKVVGFLFVTLFPFIYMLGVIKWKKK